MLNPKLLLLVVVFGLMFAFGSLFYKLQDSKLSAIQDIRAMSPANHASLCPNMTGTIYDTILLHQKCIKNSDCAVFTFDNSCSVGCHKVLNKNTKISELNEEMEKYTSACGRCVDQTCPVPPTPDQVKCESFKCVVKN